MVTNTNIPMSSDVFGSRHVKLNHSYIKKTLIIGAMKIN
jgi:hypothetical protein